jgi:toxin-antitoxin system, antitoxin component, xre family
MDKEKSKKIQIEMVKRLDELILQKKLTRAEVERKANLGNGTIRNWIVSYPAIDKFYRVAQVLEVSMEYLLYGKLTEKDKRVFQIREIKEIIEKIDDVNLQIAYDLIKGCEKRNEKEK